jgi:hypothetical protein
MYRKGDISETHNEFQRNAPDVPQYEGIVFTDGTCVIRWCTPLKSTSVWDSFETMIGVHGHPEERYGSELVWHDAAEIFEGEPKETWRKMQDENIPLDEKDYPVEMGETVPLHTCIDKNFDRENGTCPACEWWYGKFKEGEK